jgi:branched-chain amino acid transport system substrate-binding protein
MSKKLAVLVGIDVYETLPVLRMPSTDINELGFVLKELEIGGFDDVKLLLNEGRGVVEGEIENLFSGRNLNDLLFFYFFGAWNTQ